MGDFYFHFLHIFTITLPLNIFAIALNVVFSSKAKKSFSSSWILWKTFFFKVRKGRTVWEKNSWNCNEVMLIQWILRKFFSTCFQLLDVSGSLCIFCLKSNLLNVGKKSPFRIKENAHINSYKAILFDRMWSVWIVCILVLEWAVLNLRKLKISQSNPFCSCTRIRTKRVLDLTLVLYLGSCQSLPFAFYECFRRFRYQNLDRLIWRKKNLVFSKTQHMFFGA